MRDRKHYIGCTSDIKTRIKEHNAGYVRSTKNRRPLELIYTEEYRNRGKAYAREKLIKSYKGGRAFQEVLAAKK